MPEEEKKEAGQKGQEKGADFSQEIAKYTEILAQDPDSRVFALLAEAYRKSGIFDEAVKVAQEGLKKHPHYLSGRVALARAYFEGGQRDLARQEFEKVVASAPDNLMVHRHLADIYIDEGSLSEASKHLKMIVLLDPNDEKSKEQLKSISMPAQVPLEAPGSGEKMIIDSHRYEEAPVEAVEEPSPPQAAAEEPVIPETEPAEPEEKLETMTDLEMLQEPELIDQAGEFEEKEDEAGEPAEEPSEPEEPYFELTDTEEPPSGEELPDTVVEIEAEEQPAADTAVSAAVGAVSEKPDGWEEVMEEIVAEEAPKDELNTETLAEIYVQQGFYDKALSIYRKILAENPDDSRLQKKCRELEDLSIVTEKPSVEEPPSMEKALEEKAEKAPAAEKETFEAAPEIESKEVLSSEEDALKTLRNWLNRLKSEKK